MSLFVPETGRSKQEQTRPEGRAEGPGEELLRHVIRGRPPLAVAARLLDHRLGISNCYRQPPRVMNQFYF